MSETMEHAQAQLAADSADSATTSAALGVASAHAALLPANPAPQTCSTCGSSVNAAAVRAPTVREAQTPPTPWVYAVGRIEMRFPRISVEKELAQAIGRTDTKGLTDRQVLHAVLSAPENAYLLRQLCWVMCVRGLETYLLAPRDPLNFALLRDTVRPNPKASDLDVVMGIKGPVAPPQLCNGLMVPVVSFDQIYSFDQESLIRAMPRPEKTDAESFQHAAHEVLERILMMTDNAGATDYHRALNYLAVRYPRIYEAVTHAYQHDESLSGVDARPSALGGARNVLEVIFSFTNRNTDVVSKFFVRVDVTDEFPFLVTPLSPFFDW